MGNGSSGFNRAITGHWTHTSLTNYNCTENNAGSIMLSLSSLHLCMCCPRLPVYRPCRTHCVHLPYISQYGKCVLNCNGWTTSLRRYTESAFFRVDDGTHLRRRRGTLSNRRRFLPVYFPKGKVKTACLDFPRGSVSRGWYWGGVPPARGNQVGKEDPASCKWWGHLNSPSNCDLELETSWKQFCAFIMYK